MKSKFYMLSLLMSGLALISCEKKGVYQEKTEDSAGKANLFSYSTQQQIELNIKYDVPAGYQVAFEAYYTNPIQINEAGDYIKNPQTKPFLTGRTDEKGEFHFSLEIPAYTKNIYVYSENFGVPTLLKGTVEGNILRVSETEKDITKTITKTSTKNYTQWNKQTYSCKSHDFTKQNITVDDNMMEIINNTLPKDKDIISSYFYEKITLKEKAEVLLYFISNGSSERANALAYYVIPEGETWDQAKINKNLIWAFPDLNSNQKGEGIKLVHYLNGEASSIFPTGSTIAFALLVDVRPNGNLENPAHIMYSEKKYNSYTVKYTGGSTVSANHPHMGAFKAGENVILSFEDQPYHEGFIPGDFRDEVFILKATPPSSLPDNIEEGVTDPDEDPKYDQGTIIHSGILAFEDNWPDKGDYDLNDIMISYVRTVNWRYSDMKVVSIDEEYTFLHDGATFNNSFGYELGAQIKTNNIKSVVITSDYKCKGQGLDPDLENATIMLFNKGKKVTAGTTFKVHTVLNTAIDYFNFNLYPYNPFIVVNGYNNEEDNYLKNNRIEVHLPQKYTPTAKADFSLFGTGDDKSADNKYYIRSGNYPFALDLSLNIFNSAELPAFSIPKEDSPIDASYPDFKIWVESNGTSAKDWYIKK